jgi:hypothetical protein
MPSFDELNRETVGDITPVGGVRHFTSKEKDTALSIFE